MNNHPLLIFERFLDKNHLLTHRMATDPEFYALCQDYEICFKASQYWAASSEPEARDSLAEYHTLVRELEKEIFDNLKSSEPHQLD